MAEGDKTAMEFLDEHGAARTMPPEAEPQILEEGTMADHPFRPAGAPLARCAQCGGPESAHPKRVHLRLIVFLYLLMRDEVPSGRVMTVMNQIEALGDKVPEFTAPELQALATRYAGLLS